jgi:hypothetical protein
MQYADYAICGLLILNLIVMTDLALSARLLRSTGSQLFRLVYQVYEICVESPSSSGFIVPVQGYVVWVFRKGKWTLGTAGCSEGHEPGPPPRVPGLFEGQRVRRLCRKQAQ